MRILGIDSAQVELKCRRGSGWHYRTRGGQVISHPSAYAKCAWSNMVYCASTAYDVVGPRHPLFWEAVRSVILGLRRAARKKERAGS